jgi:hypothetical protein
MDVGEWLCGFGLERYETVFREHAIDMDVLADLTNGELAQIGVPLGDRKRLLKAVAGLSKIERSFSAKGRRSSRRSQPARDLRAPCRRLGGGTSSGRDDVLRSRRIDKPRDAA